MDEHPTIMLPGWSSTDTEYVQERTELRNHVARFLEQRRAAIIGDAIALFPFAGVDSGEPESHRRLGASILQLLTAAAGDGELDARNKLVAELRETAEAETITIKQLFGLIHLVERTALDALAGEEAFGAGSEPWPTLAELVRRSSFDVLAAYTEWLNREPGGDALTDGLTTLHTKPVLVAATAKEIQRAERFRHPFALIVIDVDKLSEINARYGYRSGDRVLERLGILMRNYFREQDWVGRCDGDGFAVLLPETRHEQAVVLADRVRTTVEGRMALHDYRSQAEDPVTVSVAVVSVESVDRTTRAEQLFEEANQAIQRAKLAGRNRVEQVEVAGAPPRDPNRLA